MVSSEKSMLTCITSSLWLPTCFTRTSFSNRLATFAFSISLFQWPTFDSQHSPIFLWNCTIISGDLQTPSLLRIRRSSCLTPLWKNCRNTVCDFWHGLISSSSSNWCYQGHCLDFLDIRLWRISHIKRTSDTIHPELWTPHIPLMNQNFIQKYGQIIGSWLFLNWICLIVTIFLEFFADGSSQRIRQLYPNIRVLECQIRNRFPFFSAQIYHDRFRLIMKRAERFNATTRVNNYHFSFGAWTFK